ncbi:MAG: hypothetical protein BMS9Abin07_0147 [Acidimicrobiia bacterium]|nr:MAG: hypothetical protein BMS9Abin07_0147 [Acidimicrobiia bacterium]
MSNELRSLADEYHQYNLEHNPTEAHMQGDYRYADRFEQASRADEDRRIARLREFGARARTIDPTTLEPQDTLTREVLIFEVETKADLEETREAEFAVDPIFGLHIYAQLLPPMLSVPDADVAAAMVEKWKSYAGTIDQMTERYREGVAAGRTPAQFAVEAVIDQLNEWLALPIEKDPLLMTQTPPDFSDEQTAEWKDALAEAVRNSVRPAVERQRNALRDEVLPVSRPKGSEGLSFLPDGDLVYSRAILRYTTLPMQAAEIHQIGLQQIARLADEYRQLGPDVFGTDDLDEIFAKLRDDSKLHHSSGADIVKVSEDAFARARKEMPDWFGKLPKADCLVQETSSGAQAFYFPAADDGSRPGMFFMNTADPSSWGIHEVESTAFHEGIPGHHLQNAIAQELGDSVPDFRRHLHIVAYGEGWGLYSERVSDEMGIYGSDLDRMGMVVGDSMRAGRLVVDTGMHALGWSRQQAINYLAENTPMSMHTITEEIDRYIASMPGQALSYMIGRLEIQRMRREAEEAMGDRFDIKAFHDTVLGSGAVPLETLDRMVSEWAASA